MTPIPFDADLTVTLKAAQWQIVLEGLGEVALKRSGDVNQAIVQQIETQAVRLAQPLVNGADSHVRD